MSEGFTGALRGTRTLIQILEEPIDWFVRRVVNNKKGYPPLWLRQKVGSLNDFEGSGGEYIAYLKLLCNLQPGDRLLDIGCGCGLVCLQINENTNITEYLGNGRYVGLDIDGKLVDWCNKNIRSRYPICQFSVPLPKANLFNYKFDVVLAKSLFTHLLSNETEDYLKLIKDHIGPGGRCLSTFFLLNKIEPKGRYTFKFVSYPEAYERISKKRAAVAYDEKWLLSLLKKMEFSVDIYYGSWRGNGKGLSFQDIIILTGR